MVAPVAAFPSASPRRALSASSLMRRGFLGAHACAHALLSCGMAPQSGRTYPTARALYAAVNAQLRCAVEVAMRHPTLETLRDVYAAIDAAMVAAKRATRSVVAGRSINRAAWSLSMAGLHAAIEDLEQGLERIPLLPASAPDYPSDD